jgi:hypothetical protein
MKGVLKMKGQHFFYVGLGVLLLALLVAFGQASIAKPEAGQLAPAGVVAPLTEATTGSASAAANPELMVAGRYPASVEEKPESTFLAANPELSVARRYTVNEEVSQPEAYDIEMLRIQRYAEVAEKRAEAAFLAANPELMVARRYAAVESEVDPDRNIGLLEFFTGPNETNEQRTIERKADEDIGLLEFFRPQTIKDISAPDQLSTFLAANPELMVAQRYPAVTKDEVVASPSLYWTPSRSGSSPTVPPEARQMTEARLLAANPELQAAQRYTMAAWKAEAAFLAANPELMVAHRYIPLENKVDPDGDIGLLEFFRP